MIPAYKLIHSRQSIYIPTSGLLVGEPSAQYKFHYGNRVQCLPAHRHALYMSINSLCDLSSVAQGTDMKSLWNASSHTTPLISNDELTQLLAISSEQEAEQPSVKVFDTHHFYMQFLEFTLANASANNLPMLKDPFESFSKRSWCWSCSQNTLLPPSFQCKLQRQSLILIVWRGIFNQRLTLMFIRCVPVSKGKR